MRKRQCPVLIETYQGLFPAGLRAANVAQPSEVALAVREKGWTPYRVRFDTKAHVWIAKVIDWGEAA